MTTKVQNPFDILKKMEADVYHKNTVTMRNRTTADFQYIHNVTHKVSRDFRIVTESVGTLIVQGIAYKREHCPITIDIDYVKWNGTDIKDVLLATGYLDEVEECATKWAQDNLFTDDLKQTA